MGAERTESMNHPAVERVKRPSPTSAVLGGTGMLGHKMFQLLRDRFARVYCLMHQDPGIAPFRRIPMFQTDEVISGVNAFDFDKLSGTLSEIRPEFLINCIGVIKQRDLASSYIPTITINSLLPHRLADLSSTWGGRLIHFSTDCVFSGRRGMYKEEDLSDAEDLYGKTKFLGETVEANALTLRTSIIGRELVNHRSLLDWFLGNDGGKVKGYKKAIYSGVTTNHLVDVVANIMTDHPQLSGLYQVASEPIAKYDLLCLLRDAYALNIEMEPVDGEQTDRSMDGSKFRGATGYVCPKWEVLVKELAEDATPYREWLA